MAEVFQIAVSPGDRRGNHSQPLVSGRESEGADFFDARQPDRFVANDAAGADRPAGRFELRFDQKNQIATGFHHAEHGGEDRGERDETHIPHPEPRAGIEIRTLEKTRVHALAASNPRVGPQPPIELVFSRVDRVNHRRTALQQAIRETARGCAHIQTNLPGGIEAKGVQGRLELVASTADEFFHRDQTQLVIGSNRRAGLGFALAVEKHPTGHRRARGGLRAIAQPGLH